VDVDSLVDRLQGDLLVPLLLGLSSAFAFLAILARAHLQTRALAALARECRRRREAEERVESRLGYSPRLGRLRRLEADLERRLAR